MDSFLLNNKAKVNTGTRTLNANDDDGDNGGDDDDGYGDDDGDDGDDGDDADDKAKVNTVVMMMMDNYEDLEDDH